MPPLTAWLLRVLHHKIVAVFALLPLITWGAAAAADDRRIDDGSEARSYTYEYRYSENGPSSSIVFAILPDTQYYSEGAPYIFESQTKWLAEYSNEIGSPFILHLGDVVQSGSVEPQWVAADEAMSLLELKGNNYSVAPGNHDLLNQGLDENRNPDQEFYLQYFSETRAAMQPTFGGRDPLGYSEFHIMSKNGVDFLILALDWRASTSTLDWARGVLKEYPTMPTILTSHEFLVPQSNGGATRTSHGNYIWNGLVTNHDNIFMVICGHIGGSGYLVNKNDFGHDVFQLICNFQSMHAGGNGYMRLMELNFVDGTMEHLTFSPFVMHLYNEGGKEALGPYDVVELTDPTNKYLVEFDLVERLEAMNAMIPDEWRRSGRTASLLDPVRSMIVAVPPPPTNVWREPSGPDDFPNVTKTLAHWRFDGNYADGQPLTFSDVIKDLTGFGNDMVRTDIGDSQLDYLSWSKDHHPLSVSGGSVCFTNPDRSSGGFLTTVPGSKLNRPKFTKGFTIEAFVKLAPTWDNLQHRWTGIVTRANTGLEGGKTEGDLNEPLAVLGVSPSREVQFASFPDNLEGFVTAWSSGIEKDSWYHVAAVNDGTATRLYIDGYPARRDPVHEETINGIARATTTGWLLGAKSGDKGWSIGSSTYGDRRKVFSGCIGEVRIVGRALSTKEFLIARRAPDTA